MQITQLRGLLFHLDPAVAEVNHKSEENSLDPIRVEATSLGNFFKKPQKGLLRKAVLVVLYGEGHADIWRKMEGGLYMILEIEHLQQIFELPNKKGKKLG